MKIIECVQLSPEWWEARRGIPTASEFNRIITAVKAEPSKAQEGYIDQLIGDVMSLHPRVLTEQYNNPAMRHGKDTEDEARRWYAVERDAEVCQVGFVTDDAGHFGCSPDGLVYSEAGELPAGGLELKCPQPETHVRYLREWRESRKIPQEYKAQVHGCLIVTGLPWWDFMSYAGGLPPLLVRVAPDDFTRLLRENLIAFRARYVKALKEIYGTELPADRRDWNEADWCFHKVASA